MPPDRYEEVLARTRFGAPKVVHAPGRPDLTRDVDGVISGYLSMSYAAPHLFGDDLDAFVADLRALLEARTTTGRFSDWPGDTAVLLAESRRADGVDPSLAVAGEGWVPRPGAVILAPLSASGDESRMAVAIREIRSARRWSTALHRRPPRRDGAPSRSRRSAELWSPRHEHGPRRGQA